MGATRRPLKRVDEGDSATDLALVDNLIGDGVVTYCPLTSEGGYETLYEDSRPLPGGPVFNSRGVRDPARCVQNLQRHEIAPFVVVKNHTGLVLITLGNRHVVLQDHGVSVCRS